MRVLRSALLLLWVALFCSVLSAQNTINVPGDVATIQAAINSAQFGDTVLVAPGTYFENLDFLGKAITVKSSGGAQVTIIDGSATTHVVQFKSGETRQAVLDGFTIRNGYDAFGQGPGIFILNSGPTIQNNIITGNTGCLVSAVYSHFASPVILNNTVSGNGQVSGGCSGGLGGGIYIVGELSAVSPTQVIGNTIANNGAINGSGGGIALFAAGHAVVRNNVMRGNYATSFGSFYAVNMNQEVIVGNLITDNNDGSVYLSVPAAATGITFLNNTIVTTGTNTGYGLDLAGFYGSSTVKNNLIIGTSAVTPLYCDTTYSSILPNATNNDVFSPAAASSYGGGCSSLMGTSSNGSFDPQFMDQAHGNYHLQIRSAAVDAGDNNAPALPVTDVDGNNRILDGNSDGNAVVDLGAYEFVPGQAPSGYAALSPASIGFGQVQTGTTSSAQTFLLTNTGTADLNIASVVASSPFVIAFNNCPSILSAGISCSVAVVFSPTSDGASSGTLTVTSDATNGAATATLSGTGVPAGPTISPNPINFGSVLVNSTSTQNVYVTNTSATTLTLRTIGFAPFYSGVPGGCSSGTVLAPGASCGMGIDFSPTRMGTLNGTVTITTTPPSMPSFASITGVAIAPVVNVDQTSLSFGTQHIGTTSAAQTVNVSNTGTAPLRIYSVGTSGAFAQTDNCGLSLAAGASCSITVTFSPTVRWAYTSNLSISSNSMQTATTTNIALTGTGTAPVLSLNPSSLTFSSQVIGTTSAPQSITVSNSGDATLNIASIAISGNFQMTNPCPATLAPNASCNLSVTYSPVAHGTDSGSISITSDAAGNPATVALSGTAVAPMMALSPASVSFAGQLVGTTSAAQVVTLSNSGDAALAVGSIAIGAPFSQTNNCGTSVAAGASCSINVTFSPSARGSAAQNLSVNVASPATSQSVPVSGTGVAPVLSVSPASAAFTDQLVGTTSTAQVFTLSNTGDAALLISSIALSAPFSQTNNCGASVAAGGTCSINVTFSPTARGTATQVLSVNVAAPATSQSVTVSGTGIAPVLSVSPSTVTFASQLVGAVSAPQTITVTNTGDAALSLTGFSVAAPFSATPNCASTLAPNTSCTVSVTFAPTARGSVSSNLGVQVAAPATSQTVSVTGTGVAPILSLSPSSVNFGAQAVGTTSAVQIVTLSNVGDASMNLNNITVGSPFAQNNNCGTSLGAGTSCTISITFTPLARQSYSGTLAVSDSASGSPHSVAVSGMGAAPVASLSTNTLAFGNLPTNTAASQSFTLTNTGELPLNISSIITTGSFSQSSTCPASLPSQNSCAVTVSFSPVLVGAQNGTLTISDNDLNGPQSVSLSGTGVDFGIAANPSSFSVRRVGSGATTVTVNPLGGAFPYPVTLSCSGLPRSTTCNFAQNPVTPGATGTSVSLTINPTSNTPTGTYNVSVTGASGLQQHSTSLILKITK